MGNSASSQKYHPDAVGPASPIWAPQSKFNQHPSSPSLTSKDHAPSPSTISRIPVPLYRDHQPVQQKDSRRSLSGPIRNRPSNPTSSSPSSSSPPIGSRSIADSLPHSSSSQSVVSNAHPHKAGVFESTDPAGSVPSFFPPKVSAQPRQPPIVELEDEARSILEPSDHGSPHTLPIPLAEALKLGLGKSADELQRKFKEQEEEAARVRPLSSGPDPIEMIQEEGSWMNQKGKKRETGETDRERLLAYWEQHEAGSQNSSLRGLRSTTTSPDHTPDPNTHVKPGIRRPRPHSWNSNQRPTSSQTIMSFATNDSGNSGWSSEWQDTRGGVASTSSRPASSSSREIAFTPIPGYSSAYSYGAELSTPMEEEEEWQTPGERPDMDRFSFSQDGEQDQDQAGDSDTEVNGDRITPQPRSPQLTAHAQVSTAPQPPTASLLAPPQHSVNSSDQMNTSRKHSKASLLSAAAASSTADPELGAEQEDGRSSHDRRRRSLLAGLGDSMKLDDGQEMHDQQIGDLGEKAEEEEAREEERDRMEIEETIGLALEGPPESGHQWPKSNSLRSSRISNRTNMSAETYALHADVETLRKGPSPMIDRRAIDELFEGDKSRDKMEGVIESDGGDDSRQSISHPPPTSPVKRNRAASLMDRIRGRVRKGSEASVFDPHSTPSATSQDWSTLGNPNSPSSPSDQLQTTPRSISTGSFFNSRTNRPRAQSAAQPVNRSIFPPSTPAAQSPSQERRGSDAMVVDQDGLSEGISETTTKPSRSTSITRRALLRRKPSNPRIKKIPNNQASTFVVSGSAAVPAASSSKTLAHKRSATGSITNASPRSHSARSVRSKRSSGASLRSAYRRENPNFSDSSLGHGDMKRTPSRSEDQNDNNKLLKVSPPSLSLRRKGSPMPIRDSYLSEQRRPLPLPASAARDTPTSSINQINVESEQSATPSRKVKPRLVRIGLGRRNSENANVNAESPGAWEDVETADAGKKSMEGHPSPIEASPVLSPNNNNRRWSGGWSWSKRSPNVPTVELPLPSNEATEVRAVSPLAHIESHGEQQSNSNHPTVANSSSYRSPSSSFTSLAPPPAPALPPPPRKSNKRRTDSSSASLVETSSSAQPSPSEASFPNVALSSRKGSLPDFFPSQERKRFSNDSHSNGNRDSTASSSSSPHDRTASPSSPRPDISPNLAPTVSGLVAFAPPSPTAIAGTSLDERVHQNHEPGSETSRGDSETVSDAGMKEVLLSENDEDFSRAHNFNATEVEGQDFPNFSTPKSSPSQQRRSRNGSSIPPPALSPVKEASIHKTPSFASETVMESSHSRPALPHSISPSSSTVDLKKFASTVGPAPYSPPAASSTATSSNPNSRFNPTSLAAQKSSSSFQKHAGEDASFSSSSPSASLRQLLNMHPQSRVRKPSQAESDVSLMSANGKVLDSVSLASAPTASTSPGRRLGSQHSHSRSLSGASNAGGAEDRLSSLLVESAEHSFSVGNEYHSLPRTPRRPLPPIPDHAPIQTRPSRSFSLPSGKAPVVSSNAELRSWTQVNEEDEENLLSKFRSREAITQTRRPEPPRAPKTLINSSKPHGSSLASELGLQGATDKDRRQRTFSAPTAPQIRSSNHHIHSKQSPNEQQPPVPFANSGVQASLAALAALEARSGDEEDEDPRAAWARERILGVKDGSTSIISKLGVLNDRDALGRRSASEEISGSEIELRGSRDRRRASPYSKSRRARAEGNRSSDGGYSSSAKGGGEARRRPKSAFSTQGAFHHKEFTGMATASSASLAEFEASHDGSDGATAMRNERFNRSNSRPIPPSFFVSPPAPVSNQEAMQVDSSAQIIPQPVNDWDEMVVPALRKRLEQEKQFEMEQEQMHSGRGHVPSDSVNHQTSSSNLSSNVSPTLASSSAYNPLSSSGFMGSSLESRTTAAPFPNSSPRSSRLCASGPSKREGRRSFEAQDHRFPEEAKDDLQQDDGGRRRRRSETSRSYHHQSSPKQTRPKTSERRQVADDRDRYGSLSSSFRTPNPASRNHSPNQTFSHLSSKSRNHQFSSPRRSVSHEISSVNNKSPQTASLNMSVRTGATPSNSRRSGKKPSKQGFSGEDILAWQSSISSGFVG